MPELFLNILWWVWFWITTSMLMPRPAVSHESHDTATTWQCQLASSLVLWGSFVSSHPRRSWLVQVHCCERSLPISKLCDDWRHQTYTLTLRAFNLPRSQLLQLQFLHILFICILWSHEWRCTCGAHTLVAKLCDRSIKTSSCQCNATYINPVGTNKAARPLSAHSVRLRPKDLWFPLVW